MDPRRVRQPPAAEARFVRQRELVVGVTYEANVPPEGSEPILPVLDLPRTRAFYQSLGFTAGYHHDRYEILRRGYLVVHLEQTDDLVPERNTCSCYWRVMDADRLYHEFAALGLPFTGLPRLTDPQDEPWGMREFTLKDPSGNLIRVGHELASDNPENGT